MQLQQIAGIAVALAALAIAGYAYLQADIETVPQSAAIASGNPTENGLFVVRIEPEEKPVSVGPIHAWLVSVNDPQGMPVEGAKVSLDGGMPSHGHGLPTIPETLGEIQPGIYRIDGVKFSMIGPWELVVEIESGDQSDSVRFDLEIE